MFFRILKQFFYFVLFLGFFADCLLSVAADSTLNNNFNFLAVADIHFDPFIACDKKVPCPLIENLRRSPVKEWRKLFSEYDKSHTKYRQNTRFPLFSSSMSALQQAGKDNEIQFVLILGDFLGHDFQKFYKKFSRDKSPQGYQSFVKKMFEFFKNEFNANFPFLDVYAVLGNNDSYHGDYFSQTHGQFFSDLTGIWSQLIKNKDNQKSLENEFSIGGYYVVNIPNHTNLRLIILNSVLFSTKVRGRDLNIAANMELNWLRKELQKVKANNQKALVAMHIPMRVDVYASSHIKLFTLIELWKKQYTERFETIMQEFSPQIIAILAGHLHSDWYQMLSLKNGGKKIPVIGTQSISPIFGNNPGFKIYQFSYKTMKLNNYKTYYYPLNKTSSWQSN